jgi:hypothetical protein
MDSSPASHRQLLSAGGVGLALLVATAALPYNHFTSAGGGGDMILYERFATNVYDGLTPYHEFFFEYPPAAIVPMLVPKLTGLTYAVAFRGTMLVLLAATLWLLLLTLRRLRADATQVWGGALLLGASPALLGPVLFERFDAWPAFLLSLAIVLVVCERIALGAVALAVAICAKVYPAAAVPAFFIYALAIRGRDVVVRAVAAGVAAGLVIVLPFAVIGFGGLGFSFYVQFKRPLQIETLGASVLLAFDRLGLYTADVQPGLSRELGGTLPQVVALASTALQLGAILASVWWLWRGSRSAFATTTAVAAAVAAFITFGKVLSPQYVVWLVPLVPLVARQVWVKAMGAAVAAMALTNLYFPWHYGGITHVTNWIWVLLVRNIALTVLTVFLLLELRAGARRGTDPDREAVDELPSVAE